MRRAINGFLGSSGGVNGRHQTFNDAKLVVDHFCQRCQAVGNLKWDEVGVDVVAEATGIFLTDETARKHITAGAKKVVLTGPSKDDTPMFVRGAN